MLQAYVDRFNEAVDAAGLENAQELVGHTPVRGADHRLASCRSRSRRRTTRKVARVVYNRLDPDTWGDTGGFLGLDSTLNYAQPDLGHLAEHRAVGSRTARTTPTPGRACRRRRSTRPGEEAIDAALHPEDGDWLYWVTVNLDTGETKFATNHDEFLVYKAEFEDWCAANPGKC